MRLKRYIDFVNLKQEQFIEQGYIERQSDKDVYFEWRPI